MRSKKRGIYFSFIYTSSRIRDCHERVYVILSLTLNGIDWMQMCKVLFVVIVVVVCSCLTHNRKKISKRKKNNSRRKISAAFEHRHHHQLLHRQQFRSISKIYHCKKDGKMRGEGDWKFFLKKN